MAELPEVLGAQAIQGGPVELRGPPDEVVNLGGERVAVSVVPAVLRDVASVGEDVLRQPVLGLAGQEVAPLEQQDPLARRRELVDQRSPSGATPDHDHVVVAHTLTPISWRRSLRMIRAAASIRARWEKAWGKFPRWRPVVVSNSSA